MSLFKPSKRATAMIAASKETPPASLGIAYSLQRKRAKAKNITEEHTGESDSAPATRESPLATADEAHKDSEDHAEEILMARGGSVAEAIMERRKAMAEGGEVDLEDNGEEDDVHGADWEGHDYDDADLSQPTDSNEDGDELDDEDSHDMVSKIRSKMKSRK